MASFPTPNAARVGSYDPKTERLPEGAVLMTESEAVNFIRNRIATWKPQEQVWALQFAPYLQAFGSLVAGWNLFMAYRSFFAIRDANFLLLAAYGASGMPSLLTSQYAMRQQEQLIVEFGTNVKKAPSCNICWQLRAAFSHTVVAVGLPHFVTGTYFIGAAALLRTYPVPNLLDWRKVGALTRNMYASNSRGALLFAALNMAGSLMLTSKQQEQLVVVLERLQGVPEASAAVNESPFDQ